MHMFNDRLQLSPVYYNKTTKDMLTSIPGIAGTVPGLQNVGEIRNRGFELPKSYEGIRIRFSGVCTGWMLLRASLHDPVMVLNLEGHTPRDLEIITGIAQSLVEGFDKLDLSAL